MFMPTDSTLPAEDARPVPEALLMLFSLDGSFAYTVWGVPLLTQSGSCMVVDQMDLRLAMRYLLVHGACLP